MKSTDLSFLVVGTGAIGRITAALLKKMDTMLKLSVNMTITLISFPGRALR